MLDDAWLTSGTSDPGFTSGLDETVDEPAAASSTHRLDLLLTRGADGVELPVDEAVVVGADPLNGRPAGCGRRTTPESWRACARRGDTGRMREGRPDEHVAPTGARGAGVTWAAAG